ncbi:acyl-CoA dehydrogenase family protein [Nocardioides sp.]|uniref:acyl-CoA dehydrogenase family protein n=1 Tax=Nocardioides sp. TaxID=35761 RepID=UPI002B790A26|nr:acyl-CoA dehydrogenase family protein [Nocardioides sp.]HVX55648.1 acyl-CoA dehydrogenase family protein [Nocardioides sp.]
MSVDLSWEKLPDAEELRDIRDLVRSFVAAELAPHEAEVDEAGEVPDELRRRVTERAVAAGLYAFNMPVEAGGPGLSFLAQTVVRRELAHSSFALADLVCRPPRTLLNGDPAQRERWLAPAVRGEVRFAFALTEPEAGSDATAMRTRAVWTPDGYRIDGVKHFISHGGVADFVIVYAHTFREGTDEGITAFVVRRGQPGFRCTRHERTMGWRGSPVSELVFENCLVPAEDVIGEPGQGLRLALAQINEARLGVAAHCAGMAEHALALALDHARTRTQFGRPLAANQGLQWKLADMACRVEQARCLVTDVALAVDRAGLGDRDTSRYRIPMAKLTASELAGSVVDDALQLFGGSGFMQGTTVERMYRDVRAFRLGEGTSEIQRNSIGRALIGRLETP